MNYLLLLGLGGLVILMAALALRRPRVVICASVYSLLLGQSFPVAYIGDRPVNISTDHIVLPGLLLAWLITLLPRWKRVTVPRFVRFYILFSLWALLTLAFSISRHGVTEHLAAFVETSKWFMYTLVFFPCMDLLRGQGEASLVLKHLGVATLIVALVGYVQWIALPSRSVANIVGTFGSIARRDQITTKNAFAVYMAMACLVVTGLFVYRRVRLRWLAVLGALATLVLWSLSRSALLCFVAGVLWLFVSKRAGRRISLSVRHRTVWLCAVGAIVAAGAIMSSAARGFGEHTPVGRLGSLFGDPEESQAARGVATRLELLSTGLGALKRRPITGYGFHARRLEISGLTIVDNFYLDVALDTGVSGLFLCLFLLYSIMRFLGRTYRLGLSTGQIDLAAYAWGARGAALCLAVSGASGSIPYVGRILGTGSIFLACLYVWQRYPRGVRP